MALKNIITESTTYDATPLDPGSTSGGYGQYNVTLPTQDNDEKLIETELSGGSIVREVAYNDGLTSLTADNRLAKLNHWYTMPPYIGSLNGYLAQIKAVTGVEITATVSRQVLVPGYEGNVWEHLKEFLSAYGWEITANGVIQWPRRVNVAPKGILTESWSINTQESTEWVTIHWRDILRSGSSIELFAPDTPLSVDANEILVQDIEISGSMLSVNQPICLDYVPANTDYSGTSGVYCVAGKDGKPILASRWKAGGGDLRVELTSDPGIIRVILIGSKVEEYAPYQIAATAGSSNFYNSLHVTGSGMMWNEREFTSHTGAPRATDSTETTTEINNPFVIGYDMAVNAALRSAQSNSGGLRQVSMSLMHDQNLNVGDRATLFDGVHRVVSVTDNPENQGVTFESDTLFSDWNNSHSGMTIEQFNQLHAGERFIDFNTRSLV